LTASSDSVLYPVPQAAYLVAGIQILTADISTESSIPFWRRKSLAEMTEAEWESLCDGCGRCCLIKMTADDSNETYYLDVACSLLDTDTCRCTDYAHKIERNVGCFHLTPAMVPHLDWMPPTCGYRLVGQGRDLRACWNTIRWIGRATRCLPTRGAPGLWRCLVESTLASQRHSVLAAVWIST
jgi:uncharacterized cysteine cluster protein YcgN (CxxCxxCC family)